MFEKINILIYFVNFLWIGEDQKQQLMNVYDQQEVEASDLYNVICVNIELYNKKNYNVEHDKRHHTGFYWSG